MVRDIICMEGRVPPYISSKHPHVVLLLTENVCLSSDWKYFIVLRLKVFCYGNSLSSWLFKTPLKLLSLVLLIFPLFLSLAL